MLFYLKIRYIIYIKLNKKMPRVGDYQKCKIYKIISYSRPELVYYGHTCQELSNRMTAHRAPSNKCKSKLIIDVGDAVILLVLEFPCQCKNEANAKEAEYILANVCVNKNIPNRTQQQYNIDNKEYINEQHKQYYNDHKPKIVEDQKQYYDENKPEIVEYQKQYYDENKPEILVKNKQYYDENKPEILVKHKQYYARNIGKT